MLTATFSSLVAGEVPTATLTWGDAKPDSQVYSQARDYENRGLAALQAGDEQRAIKLFEEAVHLLEPGLP
jgi:Tfp pilus assembly protein PilF